MVEFGYIPHLESYRCLLLGLCSEGDYEKAKYEFRELLLRGYNCDEIAWKILFEGVLGEGHANVLSEMLSIMQEMNCFISPQTLAMLTMNLGCEVPAELSEAKG